MADANLEECTVNILTLLKYCQYILVALPHTNLNFKQDKIVPHRTFGTVCRKIQRLVSECLG